MSRYYEEARELSRAVHRLVDDPRRTPAPLRHLLRRRPRHHGSGQSRRREAGGKTIGLSIELPHEQWPNRYISPELNFQFHYFFMRKLWFAQLAKALIVFPGGFGTMDELWEMLTLMQTGKLQRRNLILIYGRPYWDRVAQLARNASAAAPSTSANTICCNLPTPWTRPSTAYVAASKNSTWRRTLCSLTDF